MNYSYFLQVLPVLCIFPTSFIPVVYQLYQFYTLGCVPPGRRDPSIARLGCTGLSWTEPAGCKGGSLEDWRGHMVSSLRLKISKERGQCKFPLGTARGLCGDLPGVAARSASSFGLVVGCQVGCLVACEKRPTTATRARDSSRRPALTTRAQDQRSCRELASHVGDPCPRPATRSLLGCLAGSLPG